MLGNTAPTQIADTAQSVSLRVVISAQAAGELSALCHPSESRQVARHELAGVLFGVVVDGSVVVETVRQLPPDGSSSIFEGITPKEFGEILRSGRADTSLDLFQLIGWYRFHPAGELQLDPIETAFHESFFPGHDQLGLVVRPESGGMMTLLACSRSQDGSFSRTQHCSATIAVNSRRIVRQMVELHAGPRFAEEAYIQAYRILDGNEPPSRRRWLFWAILAAVVVALVAVFFRSSTEPAPAPAAEQKIPPLSLTLTGDGPNLLVSWIGGSSAPTKAQLKIYDGDSLSEMDLTKNYSSSGSLTVARHSGNVQAIISVTDGYRTWQSQSSLVDENFRSTQKAHADLAAVGKTSQDQSQLNALRNQNQRLESTVKLLRQQLEFAPYHSRHKK